MPDQTKHEKLILYIILNFLKIACSAFVNFEISIGKGFLFRDLKRTYRSDERDLKRFSSTLTYDIQLFITLNKIIQKQILTYKQLDLFEPFR